MTELFFELLSEEIPARMQARAAEDLKKLVLDGFKEAGLAVGDTVAHVTPRRLVLVVNDVAAATPDISEERRGPRADAPEKAMQGFLNSVGLTRDQVEERETKKGVFLFAVIEKKGRAAADVVQEVLEAALGKLPWPKSMRWADEKIRWVRPLTSMICLLDGAVIPVGLGPLTASNTTRGHRFLAPAEFAVSDFADYAQKLEAAKVMLDREERKTIILGRARDLAEEQELVLNEDGGLLEEVAGLVEWPVPLMGAIDDQFMDVPPEVLVTSMKEHQKYFTLNTRDGALAPRFITVSNMETEDDGAVITAGNERVLRARLHDAKFFWDTDRKDKLESRLDRLEKIVFHAKLGTVSDRVIRLRGLARELSVDIPECDGKLADRAAQLCKADLVTGMVFEFTELQGIMGRYYARHDGEAQPVAEAIASHYQPAGPSDDCPTDPVAVAVALAEKLDTLAGFFAIDEKPTGSKDPFALRRAALGVIRLVLENKLRLPLRRIFAYAVDQYPAAIRREAAVEELMSFFADRLKVHLKEQGVRHDLISAVYALGSEDDLMRLLARVDALSSFLSGEDGTNLMAGYKRASNILKIEEKKDGTAHDGAVSSDLLGEEQERVLFETLVDVQHKALAAVGAEDFEGAMAEFARLRGPVDAFFEDVTVNAEDPDLRLNRLALLGRIRSAMDAVADFSKVEG